MSSLAPIFGFANPAMLWWLVAAGVPILIHLWSRQRYRETYWAAMEYLLAALRASRRRMRFEQWLLLVVRMLIIILTVAAVADPFFQRMGLAMATGGRTHRVFVIDGSYSMAHQPTDESRFDRAKQFAGQIVEASSRGDGFTLVMLADPPRVIVGTPVFEPGDFVAEINDLALRHTTADLPSTMARIEEILLSARREHPKITGEEIYFLTDLGRVGWQPQSANSAAWDEFRARSRRLAETATFFVVDLGGSGAENVALTDIEITDPFATTSGAVTVKAELRNFGRQTTNRLSAELLVDGRRIGEQTVDLPPGAETPVMFAYRFDTPGKHAMEVRLAQDQLDVDNHRWLALEVKEAIRVLSVDGRPSGLPFEGATDYLTHALAPYGRASGQTLVYPDVIPESRLLETDLNGYDCVFLANVAQFTAGEARLLESYLKEGGALVFFLGDQVMANRYNRELGGQKPGGIRILPAHLGDVVSQAPSRLDPRGYRHPIVKAFEDHQRAGLLNTPVQKYVKLSIPDESKARVALATDGGDPLVVEEPIHRGRVVLLATSADPSWTFMPKWHSFVPIVRETLAYVMAGRSGLRNLLVGQPLGATIAAPGADAPSAIHRPDGRTDSLSIRTRNHQSVWSYPETFLSGIYRTEGQSSLSGRDIYAVNVDTVESNLDKVTPEQLRDEVWPDVQVVDQTSWEGTDDRSAARIAGPSRLPQILLYLVLALLLAETLLARCFGYPSS